MANILLIEDDEQFRTMLVQMLVSDSHKVDLAVDGEVGFKLALQKKHDLIITDILLPKKDGIEIIMDLNRSGYPIPIIAISGGRRSISADFNLESAALVGVKAMLAKPFTRNDLRNALNRVLNR
ncbi:response regulator [Methylotuvimicrobium buryatense]|uniref:Response regulator n=1 Tax=Methylotuvimicrobium buryatense TaxID=95641 RepID=A0A4P9UMR3_METBY|nr:response regulator [Methylotuvimicrobium buryatense]QCW82632.1 response regulator [Methylotuvimicrobium buryatense]